LINCSSDDDSQENETPEIGKNTIFTYKGERNSNGTNYVSKIVRIDQNNGNETDIANLETGPSLHFDNFVYNKITNQILGLEGDIYETYNNINRIFKINVNDGTHSIVTLDNSGGISYNNLIIDNNNNIYAYKYSDRNGTYLPKIVRIDQNNGNETDIANFEIGLNFASLLYNEGTNQILGLESTFFGSGNSQNRLFEINLNDGNYSILNLQNSGGIFYEELIIDNNNNLYAFKGEYLLFSATNYMPRIVRIDQSNGNEIDIANFELSFYSNDTYLEDLVYNKGTKQVLGLLKSQNSLFKINVNDGTYSIVNLDNSEGIFYKELIIK
jgi:hypothetical protein